MIEWIMTFIATINSNPISAGIVGSTLMGTAAYLLRSIPHTIWFGFWNIVTIKMTVVQENMITSYNSFEEELSNAKIWYLSGSFQLIYKMFRKDIELSIGEYGFFLVRFRNGMFAILKKYTDEKVSFWHSYCYDVRFFTRKKEKIDEFFKTAFENQQIRSFGNTIKVFQRACGDWQYTEKNKIPLNKYLSEEKEEVRKKIDYFINNKDKYLKKYKPYREGFILYGKPGTGKSYFIQQLASEFSLNIYYVNIAAFANDEEFQKAMLEIKLPNIILFEDVDCAEITHQRKNFNYKEEVKTILTDKNGEKTKEGDKRTGVTLATLLNTFDGLLAQEGQIIFMTTNYITKLDNALLRAGRFNTVIEIKELEYEEIKSYLEQIYEISVDDWNIHNLKLTIAGLSSICCDISAEEAKEKLEELNKEAA